MEQHGTDTETGRWQAEGGHPPPDHSRAWWVHEIARAGTEQLDDLWHQLVEQYGEEHASRLWQEALSSSDASQT